MKVLGAVTQLIVRVPDSLELEKISGDRSTRAAPRFLSGGEVGYLSRLVGRHKEDVEAMGRDRRLNPDQRTAGELRRAIKNAGGFARLGGGDASRAEGETGRRI